MLSLSPTGVAFFNPEENVFHDGRKVKWRYNANRLEVLSCEEWPLDSRMLCIPLQGPKAYVSPMGPFGIKR
jgi:hypothetical protein